MTTAHTLRVRAIVCREDHLLVCRLETRELMFLPGGRVETDEMLDAAIRREITEETGAEVHKLEYLGAVEHRWREGNRLVHDLNHFFVAECPALQPTLTPECNDDGVTMEWIPISKIAALPLEPRAVKTLLTRWLADDRRIWWAVEDDP